MGTTGSDAGSYDFSSLGWREEELSRLAQQAEMAWPDEERILDWLGLADGMRVLDVGCGPGFVTRQIADKLPSSEITGLELDGNLAATARLVGREGELFKVLQGSVYDSGIEDDSFDFAYVRLVFQHLEEPEKALNELHRILKPGGVLAVSDVDDGLFILYPEPEGLGDLVAETARLQTERGGDRMVGRKLPFLMEQAGFSSTRFRPFMITSQSMGREVFLRVALSFRCSRVLGREKGQDAFEKMAAHVRNHNGYGVAGVFAVRGEKARHA